MCGRGYMLKRLLIKNIVYTASILILLVISFIASIYLIVNEPKLSVNERNSIIGFMCLFFMACVFY